MMTYDELMELCSSDLSFWRGRVKNYAAYLDDLAVINEENSELFVFDIVEGQVRVRPKGNATDVTRQLMATRVVDYLNFFNEVVNKILPNITISFGLILGDCGVGYDHVPVFSFQKDRDDNILLFPDVDFLKLSFFDSPEYLDVVDSELKLPEAIFVGSTTGVNPATRKSFLNTRENIDFNPSERIRAARYFQDISGVLFKLPGIVQCDSDDTAKYLSSFDFCSGGSISWREQYNYKLLISLDGNGATCSRLALALKSNSVLVKYDSKNVLYYSRALVPWQHYLPVSRDSDVVEFVARARRDPSAYDDIRKNANEFYRKYLRKFGVHCYAAVLLNEFHEIFHDASVQGARRRVDEIGSDFDVTAHLTDKGDVWFWPQSVAGFAGSNMPIESFTLVPTRESFEDREIECQCLYDDGSMSLWCQAGVTCGGKGRNKKLSGFRLRYVGSSHVVNQLKYRATFINGAVGNWVEGGRWCVDIDRSPLESMEIKVFYI